MSSFRREICPPNYILSSLSPQADKANLETNEPIVVEMTKATIHLAAPFDA
jgi:hypothetical protein